MEHAHVFLDHFHTTKLVSTSGGVIFPFARKQRNAERPAGLNMVFPGPDSIRQDSAIRL
jgi:hypothetical protein